MPSRTDLYARYLKASALLLMLTGCQSSTSDNPQHCFEQSGQAFSEVLSCYYKAQAAQPLRYESKGQEQVSGVTIRKFELTSQSWDQGGKVAPADWTHGVDLYIPDSPRGTRAVLVANDGVNHPPSKPAPDVPPNFTRQTLLNIARQTGSIVVAVSNVPNQYLTYSDDGVERTEDGSVAHSWKLFMQAPEQRPFMSVHVPMMEALVKAMDLAQKETPPGQLKSFLATGASKRGWAVWLAALTDPRVDSIVPFVIDVLNTEKVFDQTFLAYGGNWPLAYIDYYQQGVIAQRKTPAFKKLMQVEDPMTYPPAYASRLSIPKYIVNASGDDFFIPDASRQYFPELEQDNASVLRVIPNSAHDVRPFVEENLIAYIKRRQAGKTTPLLKAQEQRLSATSSELRLTLAELPIRLTRWTAHNPLARDFRYNCGVRYSAVQLPVSTNVQATQQAPKTGWSAEFFEAEFANGYVETTMVKILPDTNPTQAPPADEAFCGTLPGTPGQ
ncbi:PhoPQ-regulated protein [Pseudomonas sp. ADAK2]|uniref:PhoPQ-activated protein PqaA family protein n=1 Tax=unclassified Pseudomonas TaxID=196821 RepID=UPI001462EDEA|nr:MULTISPECIES: PhoPQ-activated protein PqaA family protein [unclassified Pseudomonas]QJI40280.1 PhoPQ-regulated protein [Pseudomonas sp. ADAK7]QJI46585.1 PhoPQ-regulated protein [Pseudomonas sp. ADAK2]